MSHSCRFFQKGKCTKGNDCPFSHTHQNTYYKKEPTQRKKYKVKKEPPTVDSNDHTLHDPVPDDTQIDIPLMIKEVNVNTYEENTDDRRLKYSLKKDKPVQSVAGEDIKKDSVVKVDEDTEKIVPLKSRLRYSLKKDQITSVEPVQKESVAVKDDIEKMVNTEKPPIKSRLKYSLKKDRVEQGNNVKDVDTSQTNHEDSFLISQPDLIKDVPVASTLTKNLGNSRLKNKLKKDTTPNDSNNDQSHTQGAEKKTIIDITTGKTKVRYALKKECTIEETIPKKVTSSTRQSNSTKNQLKKETSEATNIGNRHHYKLQNDDADKLPAQDLERTERSDHARLPIHEIIPKRKVYKLKSKKKDKSPSEATESTPKPSSSNKKTKKKTEKRSYKDNARSKHQDDEDDFFESFEGFFENFEEHISSRNSHHRHRAHREQAVKKDYYGLLELEETATDLEIRREYKKRALKLHPDKPDGDEEKFKELVEAYGVLSDPKLRAEFDQGEVDIDIDFSDIFRKGGVSQSTEFSV